MHLNIVQCILIDVFTGVIFYYVQYLKRPCHDFVTLIKTTAFYWVPEINMKIPEFVTKFHNCLAM